MQKNQVRTALFFRSLLLKLAVVEPRVEAVLRQKLLMPSLFDDVPVLHDENHVRLCGW